MRLSDAIRLGSLLVPEPKEGDINACGITMAGLASGYQKRTMGPDYYGHLIEQWPWLMNKIVICPCGQQHFVYKTAPYGIWMFDGIICGSTIVSIPFDHHVMGDRTMTIDQLADWIRSIEPDEPTEEIIDEEVPSLATLDNVHVRTDGRPSGAPAENAVVEYHIGERS